MTIFKPPPGYQTVTPYVAVRGLDAVLTFLDDIFGIRFHEKLEDANGVVRHAEVMIGDSMVMLGESPGDEFPPMPASLYVYVADVDEVYTKALASGAAEIMPPTDMFYGDRHGGIVDPAGNMWWIATRIEDLDQEEIQRRARSFWT